MLRGDEVDNWVDLKKLVERLQAGDLEVVADSGSTGADGMWLELHNPHSQSKYITAVTDARLDGEPLSLVDASVCNPSTGEGHTDRNISDLGPLTGFYVRRNQNMQIILPRATPAPGQHEISFSLAVANVMNVNAAGPVNLRPH